MYVVLDMTPIWMATRSNKLEVGLSGHRVLLRRHMPVMICAAQLLEADSDDI